MTIIFLDIAETQRRFDRLLTKVVFRKFIKISKPVTRQKIPFSSKIMASERKKDEKISVNVNDHPAKE